ncbi:hypothetical protein [Arthrobacter sp. NA-172]|uniref:hypothetical protein n=1 Tax=Arthrobacter sp. NA-172 TaxID=3367524 RepID=UPI0037541128
MEPIQIILVIAACAGALLILGFIIWLIAALVITSRAKKAFREVDDFFNQSPLMRNDHLNRRR